MAGIKQHFIPQLLLRRFGVKHPKREKTQVCVYPRDGAPFIAATDGVAAQRFFYSELLPGQETLDDRITEHEVGLHTDLESIDAIPTGEVAPSEVAARLIVHLTIRNAHAREIFKTAGTLMATEGMDRFRDPEWVAQAIGLDKAAPNIRLSEVIREEAAKIPGGEALLAMPGMEDLLFAHLKANFAREQPTMAAAIGAMQERFQREMPEIVRRAHVRALNNSLAPEGRIEKLAALHWAIEPAPQGVVVLPDCIALAVSSAEAPMIPALMVSNSENLDAVFMPLGDRKFLVGSKLERQTHRPPENWNVQASLASAEFFIAAARDPAIARLIPGIGTVVKTYIGDQLRPAFEADPRTLLDR